jgi:hypothetical protein
MDPNRLKELAGIKTPKKTHIVRWYDYVFTLVVADIMAGWFLAGVFYEGAFWAAPFIYGAGIGVLNYFYTDWYCNTRKQMEDNESKR